jgi:hypothetical protein
MKFVGDIDPVLSDGSSNENENRHSNSQQAYNNPNRSQPIMDRTV